MQILAFASSGLVWLQYAKVVVMVLLRVRALDSHPAEVLLNHTLVKDDLVATELKGMHRCAPVHVNPPSRNR